MKVWFPLSTSNFLALLMKCSKKPDSTNLYISSTTCRTLISCHTVETQQIQLTKIWVTSVNNMGIGGHYNMGVFLFDPFSGSAIEDGCGSKDVPLLFHRDIDRTAQDQLSTHP